MPGHSRASLKHARTFGPSDILRAVGAAAIRHDDVPAIGIGDFADDGADRRSLVEGGNDEAYRLHRIPQFWQGAGGVSERRFSRKSR